MKTAGTRVANQNKKNLCKMPNFKKPLDKYHKMWYNNKGGDERTPPNKTGGKTAERGISMANYTITKENGITKISASAKSEVSNIVTEALTTAFGAENVAMVRTGGSSPSNVLAVRVGTLTDEDGFSHDLCVTLDTTVKSYKERVTKKYTVEAFDFDACREAYENYLTDKATKKAEAEAKKAERKAKGSKTKAEKDAEKAKKSAELDAANARVEAKRKAEEEAKRYVVVVNPGRGSAPFVFARDTEDTERCTRTLENAKAWKDTLEMDYPDGTAKIYEADMWYRNNG